METPPNSSPSPSSAPQSGVLPDDVPLFPLQTTLFPQGVLQLQIFEVRYLDMIGRAYKAGTPFGVVSLLQGAEVRQRAGAQASGDGFAVEAFADVGTLAHIVDYTVPQPGLMVIRCRGGSRFRIHARHQLKTGLWMGRIATLADDQPLPLPEDLQPVAHTLERLVQSQSEGVAPFGPLPIEAPYRFDDCGWVANRWCDLLNLPVAQKQSLLQLDNPLLRLELVSDFLGPR